MVLVDDLWSFSDSQVKFLRSQTLFFQIQWGQPGPNIELLQTPFLQTTIIIFLKVEDLIQMLSRHHGFRLFPSKLNFHWFKPSKVVVWYWTFTETNLHPGFLIIISIDGSFDLNIRVKCFLSINNALRNTLDSHGPPHSFSGKYFSVVPWPDMKPNCISSLSIIFLTNLSDTLFKILETTSVSITASFSPSSPLLLSLYGFTMKLSPFPRSITILDDSM